MSCDSDQRKRVVFIDDREVGSVIHDMNTNELIEDSASKQRAILSDLVGQRVAIKYG